MQHVLYVLYLLYILCFRWLLSSGPWNSKNQPSARVILLCITVWCWVIPNTRVSNGFTAIHFPQNPSTAVIAWTSSWLGRRVSIMAPLLCLVSPDTVWYARVLLLFSASAMTDTGSKSFECALVSTLETYDDPENGYYINYNNYDDYTCETYYSI